MVCIAFSSFALAQPISKFEPFGLQGKTVTCIAEYGGRLYASTIGDGVFRRNLFPPDTGWVFLGLQRKKIRAIYPHKVGPIGFGITAGIEQDRGKGDTILTYCTNFSETNWAPTDSGMDRQNVSRIVGLDGFPDPTICGETFAAGSGRIYRKSGTVWEKVFDIGIGVTNTIRVGVLHGYPARGIVWAGGETAIFAPYITKSTDAGATWQTTYPNLGGDNACNSIVIHPQSDDTVYAGMEGAVIKSTNQGKTWELTGLRNTPDYFYGLAIDPENPEHLFAGGTPSRNAFALYETTNGGKDWKRIELPYELKGISSLIFDPAERGVLLIATLGSGVYRYQSGTATGVEELPLPSSVRLSQNYPNPFNPKTIIVYELGIKNFVSLKVHDVLGREVKTLVNEVKEPGVYQVEFDATHLPSGVYYYRLSIIDVNGRQGTSQTKVMVLVR
jgi:hypothetical protein